MRHLSDEELVRVYYGELPCEHLAECETCRAALENLRTWLSSTKEFAVPERGEDYGHEVWAKLAPRLNEHDGRSRFRQFRWLPQRLITVAATAALMVAAFLVGRFLPLRPDAAPVPAAFSPQARERILVVTVGEHLDRSEMVLLEFMNAAPGSQMNIRAEQERAEDLIAANRLYRQAAARAGEGVLADVLDDLERALLEIARSPSQLSSRQLEELRRRLEAQGIVFKVRVLDAGYRKRSATL